jgi:hypothetical protein
MCLKTSNPHRVEKLFENGHLAVQKGAGHGTSGLLAITLPLRFDGKRT